MVINFRYLTYIMIFLDSHIMSHKSNRSLMKDISKYLAQINYKKMTYLKKQLILFYKYYNFKIYIGYLQNFLSKISPNIFDYIL